MKSWWQRHVFNVRDLLLCCVKLLNFIAATLLSECYTNIHIDFILGLLSFHWLFLLLFYYCQIILYKLRTDSLINEHEDDDDDDDISHEMTSETGQMSVMRCQHFHNPLRLRPLGRRRWDLARIFCGFGNTTSRKRNFEFRPMRRAGEMTHPDRGAYFHCSVLFLRFSVLFIRSACKIKFD